jgi:mono/diheme cytochrome c family protein
MATWGIGGTMTVSVLAVAAAAAAGLQNGETRSVLSGVYTTTQATRGEQTYFNICVACHPRGTYSTDAFKTAWAGRPISDLFSAIKEKMPKSDPGSLTPEEAAQVLAYILKINDAPAGEVDLPSDIEALKNIKFETARSDAGKAER